MSRPPKKQKVERHAAKDSSQQDTAKPTATYKPTRGREWTLSLAIPGSIIANAQTHDLKTALVGQIARACAVFCVDEIVVFDDGQAQTRSPEDGGYTAFADPNFFLYHLLSYLETPPYLRRLLFPMHPDLRTAGALPSLDMPHHLKAHEWCRFREGVTGDQDSDKETGAAATLVHCGVDHDVKILGKLPPTTRVTLQLPAIGTVSSRQKIVATAVGPTTPREEDGFYWGYTTRQASSLSAIFTECEFEDGYDFSIGTSERGSSVERLYDKQDAAYLAPSWKHLLVVIGGVAGLEVAFDADVDLRSTGVAQVKDMFDRWVNLVPDQGSRTIRAEEAVWIAFSRLRSCIDSRGAV